jgi:hypothetical protein
MSEARNVPEIRVTSVTYRLRTDSTSHDLTRVEPLEDSFDGWTFRLEDGSLTAWPNRTYGSRESARQAIEPLLHAWSQGVYLSPARIPFQFDYESSAVDVVYPDAHNTFVFPETAVVIAETGSPTVVIGHRLLPGPDSQFMPTPLTDLLTERLRALDEGRAELPATAYMISTTVEHAFGGSKACAAALAVSGNLLSTLTRLSSKFDPHVGRKASPGDPDPLTGQELAWLKAAIFRLVRRVGEHAAGGSLEMITLDDLPPLGTQGQ